MRFKGKTLIYYLLLLLLLIYPLGQVEKLPLGISGVSVYLHDLIIVFILMVGLLTYRRSLTKIYSLRLLLPLFSFEFFSLISLLLNPLGLSLMDRLVSGSYFLRFSAYAVLYPIVFFQTKQDPCRGRKLSIALFMAGVFLAVFGLLQYFLYPNLRNLYYLGWDPHQYRLFSTFLDPNFTGLILVLSILLGLDLLFKYMDDRKIARANLVIFVNILLIFICLIAVILTYSRSSYLALLVTLPIFLLSKERSKLIKWLVLFYVLFFAAIFLLPRPFGEGVRLERLSTVQSRLESYQRAIMIIKKYPLFGVGFNAYRYAQRNMGFLPQADWLEIHSGSGADNSFLFAWATSGIGGFLSIVWLVWRILKLNIKSLALNMAVVIHSFFVNSLFYPWVLIWLWIFLGVEEGLKARR